jgi:hypothetical protein
MGYHTSYAFSASADVVFGIMADVGRLAGWLAGAELAIATWPDGTCMVGDQRYRVSLWPDERRLRWAPTTGEAWSGHAVVSALPIGGSVLQVKLALPAELRARIPHVDAILAKALRRLDEAARRNVSVQRAAVLPATS